MKTTVRFEFDNPLFYTEYNGPREIILENPPHVPQTGDSVSFRIFDFFQDKKVIAAYEKLEGGNAFYAEPLQTYYSREEIEVIILVYEEVIFKVNFPHLFERNLV